jgi:hypothetical protein
LWQFQEAHPIVLSLSTGPARPHLEVYSYDTEDI